MNRSRKLERPLGVAGIAVQVVLDDVIGRHQSRSDRARPSVALGRVRMAHRDVPEGVDDAVCDEDAAGRGPSPRSARQRPGRPIWADPRDSGSTCGFEVRLRNADDSGIAVPGGGRDRSDWGEGMQRVRKCGSTVFLEGTTGGKSCWRAVRTGPGRTEIREFPMPGCPGGQRAHEDGGRRDLRGPT